MVIVDASVAFKWFDDSEDDYLLARNLLKLYLEHKIKIQAPDLILYELANAWITKTQMTVDIVTDNLRILEQYLPDPIPVSYQLIEKAGLLAKRHGVSVYDAVYAELAQENKCDLITSDERFIGRVNLPFVKLLRK